MLAHQGSRPGAEPWPRRRSGSIVRGNTIDGNADVGIYVTADNVTVSDNRLSEDGPDGYYDVGIVSVGEGNDVRNNVVRGYDQRYFGVGAADGSGVILQVRNGK